MKYLFFTFVGVGALLAALVWTQRHADIYADGRLVCPPLPSEFRPQRIEPLLPPPAPAFTMIAASDSSPTPAAESKLEFIDPQVNPDQVTLAGFGDRSEWGLPRAMPPTGMTMASLPRGRIVEPVPVAPQMPIEPNLYLPEGATSEEGAMLTLIKQSLGAFAEPNETAEPAPFTLAEGDRVRPLTRLRNEKDFDWVKFEREGKQWWAQAEYFIRVDPRNHTSLTRRNLRIGEEAVDKHSALPPRYSPSDMVSVPDDYLLDSKDIRLRREVVEALGRMCDAAAKQGLRLRVFSGFRDFEHQKKLYLEAIEKRGPKQNGTAAPGYSEHQLGTTIDICNADKRYVLSSRFGETREGRWLYENAEKYGFRHSYTQENVTESGYKSEPWHLRYVSTRYTNAENRALAKK